MHANGKLEDIILKAIEKNFHTFALTEHMPRSENKHLYPEESSVDDLEKMFESYLHKAFTLQEKYKNKINIVVGMETEYLNNSYLEIITRKKNKVQFLVGSLHHVKEIPIDFSEELYLYAESQCEDLVLEYLDRQFELINHLKPAIVGHFDLYKMYSRENSFYRQNHIKKINRNIQAVVDYGGLFEINSRVWKRRFDADGCPSEEIINIIKSFNGRFTISDDCHGPDDVGMHYGRLYEYLKKNDIRDIWYLVSDGLMGIKFKCHSDILNDSFWKAYGV